MMNKKIFLFSVFFMAFSLASYCQNNDVTGRKILEEAKKRGLSVEQLRSTGISPEDYQKAVPGDSRPAVDESASTLERKQPEIAEHADETAAPPPPPPVETQATGQGQNGGRRGTKSLTGTGRFEGLQYFGYDIFLKAKGSVGPVEVGPVDPGYPIGAGDVLRLTLWGEIEYQYELAVDRDGNVVIPKAGQVFVAGTRLERLRETLKNYLSKFYSGLASDSPTIFMDITIARLRSNQIYIMGEVERPGAYAVSSYATAFNALYAVGGPNITGSMREIRILRDGKIAAKVDLYDYLLKGVSTDDIRLQHNDIVFVPRRGNTIGISGEVLRPGIYELTADETLKELFEMAGGLKPTAYAFRTQIDRIVPLETRGKGDSERILIDINTNAVLKADEAVALYGGDIVTVFPIRDEIYNYVDIEGGGIVRPGRYELNSGIVTLSDLIREADGLTGDAYLGRVDVVRMRDDLTDEFIHVDLFEALRRNAEHDIILKRWDRVTVYSQQEMTDLPTVTLRGYVKAPGTYPLPENMTLYDLLFKYSGLQDSLRYRNTFLDRGDIYRLGKNRESKHVIPFTVSDVWRHIPGSNITFRNGDTVTLYEKVINEIFSRVVTLSGAVRNPGTYEWKENMTLSDLIVEGGGFIEGASIMEAEVARFPEGGIPGESLADVIKVSLLDSVMVNEDIELTATTILSGKTKASEFKLLPNDVVFIRTNPDFKLSKTVTVTGEVRFPGNYVLVVYNERLSDMIHRAGGLKETAYIGGGQLFRGDQRVYIDFQRVFEKEDKKEDIVLWTGDRIVIPPKPNAVQVTGEIINPGFYKYLPGLRAKDYMDFAGGKTENGGKSVIQGPSGRLQKIGFLKNPKVADGSVITVYVKPPEKEKTDIDWSQTIRDSFALMSSALMIIYLSKQIN